MKRIASLALAMSMGLTAIAPMAQTANATGVTSSIAFAGKSAQAGAATPVQWRGGRPGYRWRPGYGWVPLVALPFAIAGAAAAASGYPPYRPYPYYGPNPYYGPYAYGPYYYGPRW
jgi:hypothetical protein